MYLNVHTWVKFELQYCNSRGMDANLLKSFLDTDFRRLINLYFSDSISFARPACPGGLYDRSGVKYLPCLPMKNGAYLIGELP